MLNFKLKTFIVVFLFSLSYTSYSYSQTVNTREKIIATYLDSLKHCWKTGDNFPYSEEYLVAIADSVNGVDQSLLNGKIFTGYFNSQGFPFFFSETPIAGHITINEITYGPIKLLYDICSDDVICIVRNKRMRENIIVMNKATVNKFTVVGHLFINCSNVSKKLDGYYELIYDGKDFSMLAKWTKKLEKYEEEGQEKIRCLEANKTLFLVSGRKVEKVEKKSDLLAFFGLDKSKNNILNKRKLPNLPVLSNETLVKLCQLFDK